MFIIFGGPFHPKLKVPFLCYSWNLFAASFFHFSYCWVCKYDAVVLSFWGKKTKHACIVCTVCSSKNTYFRGNNRGVWVFVLVVVVVVFRWGANREKQFQNFISTELNNFICRNAWLLLLPFPSMHSFMHLNAIVLKIGSVKCFLYTSQVPALTEHFHQ